MAAALGFLTIFILLAVIMMKKLSPLVALFLILTNIRLRLML